MHKWNLTLTIFRIFIVILLQRVQIRVLDIRSLIWHICTRTKNTLIHIQQRHKNEATWNAISFVHFSEIPSTEKPFYRIIYLLSAADVALYVFTCWGFAQYWQRLEWCRAFLAWLYWAVEEEINQPTTIHFLPRVVWAITTTVAKRRREKDVAEEVGTATLVKSTTCDFC